MTRNITHGHTRNRCPSPEYISWNAMLSRCYNPKNNRYYRYGARGISVCNRWNPAKGGSFENFLADMGEKPEPKRQFSLDRKKNSQPYSPRNCRWATRSEQMKNRDTFEQPLRRPDAQSEEIRRLYVDEHLSSVDISNRLNISIPTVFRRLQKLGIEARPLGTNQFSNLLSPSTNQGVKKNLMRSNSDNEKKTQVA